MCRANHVVSVLVGLLGATGLASGCDGADDPAQGEKYCEPASAAKADGAICCKDCSCNPCNQGSVCRGQISGNYKEGSTLHYLAAGFTICSTVCATDGDCQGKSAAAANGWSADETWTCKSGLDGSYCAVQVTAPTTGDCGEPCPKGCCSSTGLTCCQPPFCSGACLGSPCCK